MKPPALPDSLVNNVSGGYQDAQFLGWCRGLPRLSSNDPTRGPVLEGWKGFIPFLT